LVKRHGKQANGRVRARLMVHSPNTSYWVADCLHSLSYYFNRLGFKWTSSWGTWRRSNFDSILLPSSMLASSNGVLSF